MPTDRQSYLHAKSAHSLSLKRVFLTVKHYELNVFAQFLMNTKSIEMTLLNDSWKKGTKKISFETKSKK